MPFFELILLVASVRGWLFKIFQKVFTQVKKVYLYTLGWLKNYLEIDVKALDKGLTEYFGAALINLDPVDCLWS